MLDKATLVRCFHRADSRRPYDADRLLGGMTESHEATPGEQPAASEPGSTMEDDGLPAFERADHGADETHDVVHVLRNAPVDHRQAAHPHPACARGGRVIGNAQEVELGVPEERDEDARAEGVVQPVEVGREIAVRAPVLRARSDRQTEPAGKSAGFTRKKVDVDGVSLGGPHGNEYAAGRARPRGQLAFAFASSNAASFFIMSG